MRPKIDERNIFGVPADSQDLAIGRGCNLEKEPAGCPRDLYDSSDLPTSLRCPM